jgi:Dihydrodipicolinate synthetase family
MATDWTGVMAADVVPEQVGNTTAIASGVAGRGLARRAGSGYYQLNTTSERTMPRFKDYVPNGVIPATLLALHDDTSIDERDTRRHLREVAATRGLSAITVNGHASEVHACSFEEQQRILDLTLEEIGDKLPVISGVWADGSHNAARIARSAEAHGASALLVFPSQVFSLGGRSVAPGDGDRASVDHRRGHRSAADRVRLR